MENTPDSEKLLDLVLNTEQQKTFNVITTTSTSDSVVDTVHIADTPVVKPTKGFSGIPDSPYDKPNKPRIIASVVTPENVSQQDTTNTPDIPASSTQVETQSDLIGHDTAMTTDEEEAAEALLALGKLPDLDFDNNELSDDNANLIPIGALNSTVDINPVQIKLGSVSVPIAKQFLTINEKWVLVKFMKALGTFCV